MVHATCLMGLSHEPTFSLQIANVVADFGKLGWRSVYHLSACVIAQIGLIFLTQPDGCRSDQKLADNV